MNQKDYISLIRLAFEEDKAKHDITTRSLFGNRDTFVTKIIAKEKGILAGSFVAKDSFIYSDPSLKVKMFVKEGDSFTKNTEIIEIKGKVMGILAAERIALNFLSFLSGIATETKKAVEILSKTGIKVLDTRKTLPGFRALSKYAVRIGGGFNHRHNLREASLIKDNHISAFQNIKNQRFQGSKVIRLQENKTIRLQNSQDIKEIVFAFKKKCPGLSCQIEVDNIDQLRNVLEAKPDHILLDNMSPRLLKKCVKIIKSCSLDNIENTHINKTAPKKVNEKMNKQISIEASGGFHSGNIHKLKKTSIDFISMSSITMNAKPINFSLYS